MQSEASTRWHETRIRVRFNEVDAYHIAWHGHYVTWMEEARNDLAGRFGIDPAQIAAAGYYAPVVELELKYLRPARFGEEMLVRTRLLRTQTATLEFHCDIIGDDGKVAATGRTVHALTDKSGVLQYAVPAQIAERVEAVLAHQGV